MLLGNPNIEGSNTIAHAGGEGDHKVTSVGRPATDNKIIADSVKVALDTFTCTTRWLTCINY